MLVAEVTKKVTELMAGKIGYDAGGGQLHFSYNYFLGPINGACVTFDGIIAYINGNTVDGAHNTWWPTPTTFQEYSFTSDYRSASDAMRKADKEIGVTCFANNTSILTKNDNFNQEKIMKMLNNGDEEQLKKLVGTVFMCNRAEKTRDYAVYSHTGIIVGYDLVNKSLIIRDSTIRSGPNSGIGNSEYTADIISRNYKHFDIYEFN